MQTQIRSCAAACILLLAGSPAQAQTLQDLMGRLFIFDDHTEPLQVFARVAPSEAAGGIEIDDGFQPTAVQSNAAVMRFLTRWVGAGPGDFPVISTSGGVTFTFKGGLPEATAISAGPIFAEQGHTLGRGRAVVGARFTGTRFTTIRGKPMKDLRLNFTHANIDNNQCDTQEGRECAPLGVPLSENDILEVLLTLDINVDVAFAFASYGLSDWLEVGLVVPVVHTSLAGHSFAQILPFDTPPTGASHFIAGTPESPVLSSTQDTRGSATGIGDLGGRVKLSLVDGRRVAVAVLADLRAPTGNERNFLGTGKWAARGLGILSLHFGNFVPHVNAGYVRRGGHLGQRAGVDAALATVGFDASLASWVTFSADLLSELQVGRREFDVPPPVTFTVPTVRTVRPMDIGDARDNQVSVSLGFKFATLSSFTGVANALIPVAGKGPHPDFAWTIGVEHEF